MTEFDQDDYLLNEVMNEVDGLSKLKPGSEDHSRATSDAAKLHNQLLEEWKFAANAEKESRALDQAQAKIDLDREKLELEKKQFEDSKKWRIGEFFVKVVMDGAAIIVPACIYNTWMKRGFEFEKTGTYTSTTFRNLFGKFKPTRR